MSLTEARHSSGVPRRRRAEPRDCRSGAAVRGYRPRGVRPQRRRPAAPRGRDADPAGLEVGPLPGADRARAGRRAAGDPRLHAARGAVAGRPRPRRSGRRLPDRRPRGAAGARGRAARPRDDHGRLRRAPRARVPRPCARRAAGRIRVCLDVDAGWWPLRGRREDRRPALAGAHARAGGGARPRGGRAAGAASSTGS